MNWDAIGAVGDMVGAAAVVMSLGYLAIQIRSQSLATRQASMHNVAEGFRNAVESLRDARSADLMMRGMRDFHALNDSEKFVVLAGWVNVLRVVEEAYFLYEEGSLDERYWIGFKRYAASNMGSSGARIMWDLRKHYFNDAFQKFIEELVPIDWKVE